jgi:hypothetical protein
MLNGLAVLFVLARVVGQSLPLPRDGARGVIFFDFNL